MQISTRLIFWLKTKIYVKKLKEIIHEKIAPALKSESDIILVFAGKDISKDEGKTLF